MADFGSTTLTTTWRLDVRATPGSGSWIEVKGRTDFAPVVNPTTQDSGTYDTGIWGADDVVELKAQLTATLQRRNDSVSYDAGQEILRAAADAVPPAVIEARWYQPTVASGEAYSGLFKVQWQPQGGPRTAFNTVNAVLLGQGERTTIAMPTPSAAAVITNVLENGVTPSLATAGGDIVVIHGTLFTGLSGATAVTFGGTNATNYTVVSSTRIVATSPAKTAGAHNVVVTNGSAVASNNFSVTYA